MNMAKVRPASPFASISGKLSKRDKSYLRTNKHTGRVSVCYVDNPHQGPWSEKQTDHRKAFALRSKTASQWLKDNDPKRNGGNATKQYKAMLRKYNAQHNIGNIFAFVAKHYKDGAIQSFI